MANPDSSFLSSKRYAVVTGANKGIGLEICRQLALKGVVVVLTARDETLGREAVEKLKVVDGLSVEYHQLDVADPASVASLADFIKIQFGKLDILVNNAGVTGALVNPALLKASLAKPLDKRDYTGVFTQTHKLSEECININYYGTKRTTEALLPLLHLSDSARVVNVSSEMGKLKNIPNEWARTVLGNVEEELKEEKIDEILSEFLNDFEENQWLEKGWPSFLSAYTVSKAAVNAYTRIISKACQFAVTVNSVCPGNVKTDMNCNTGLLSVEEGAGSLVRLALLSKSCEFSGVFYVQREPSSF